MKIIHTKTVGKKRIGPFWSLSKPNQHWPLTQASLTQKIKKKVKHFSVELVHQKKVFLQIAGSSKIECYWQRQVVLWGDGQALVEATTHIKAVNCKKNWPFFDGLGSKSLGSQLFIDPKIVKVAMRPVSSRHLHAHRLSTFQDISRYSCFQRGNARLDLIETFLPAIYQL